VPVGTGCCLVLTDRMAWYVNLSCQSVMSAVLDAEVIKQAQIVIIHYNPGMARTLITVGKSTAVTIPPDLLERYGLQAGDSVELITTPDGITIVPAAGLDASFEHALRTISRERSPLLERLAEFDQNK
jgi:AbrB family looped-hinge helix DNA binding protein